MYIISKPICTALDTLAAVAAKSLQSCPTLCDPKDGSSPVSPVPGILQARTLEWAAISFSNAWKGKVKVKLLSCVWLLATPWTTAHQAPLSMGLSRQEYWSGVPLPSPTSISRQALLASSSLQHLPFIHLLTRTVENKRNRCCWTHQTALFFSWISPSFKWEQDVLSAMDVLLLWISNSEDFLRSKLNGI